MTKRRVSEEDFINMLEYKGPALTAEALGISRQAVFQRRDRIEAKRNTRIVGPREVRHKQKQRHARAELDIADGVVLVGGDAHYWPGEPSVGHRAYVEMIRRLKPVVIVQNGDVLDAATISRHPPIGWENMPMVCDELEVCKTRLKEIEDVAPDGAELYWPLGNHDARFETRLASVAPEFAGVHGVHLKDHFPAWEPCWSLFINEQNGAVIKHRFKGGIHAPHNNTLWAGRTVVTGHLHSLKVIPVSDYNGLRFGVDNGCLCDPYGPQFEGYTEDNPVNWRQGFIVLTWVSGELLWPEVVYAVNPQTVCFRGELITV